MEYSGGEYTGCGSGEGVCAGGSEFEEGIRMTRESGFGVGGWEFSMFCDEARRFARPLRRFKPVTEDPLRSSPRFMGWWTAFPRAMQLMASTSCWIGLKSLFQFATTSSMGGGGEGNPVSSQ